MTQTLTTLGKTPRGLAIHPVTHPSYTHLEKVRTVGADAPTLGKLAQQAHPGYRAVDHQEAADVHYAVGNFHAARAHQAASNGMSKSGELELPLAAMVVGSTIAGRPIVAPWQSSCAEVYEGVDSDLTLDQARMAAMAIAPRSSAQDHLDCAIAYHALAEALLPDPRGELAAAAAFIHFAGAGHDPLPMVAPDAVIDGVPDVVDAPLVKADPSRVVGHTKGGRAVPEGPALTLPKGHSGSPLLHHGATVAAAHPDFGHGEHWDASHIHAGEARKYAVGSPEHTHHTSMANAHVYAIGHKKGASMLKSTTSLGDAPTREAVAYLNQFVAEATGVDMVKGGKGSRGGVIVGFRPDGSPVYGSRRTRARVARVLSEGHPQKNTTNTEKSEGMMITLSKAMGGKKSGEGSRGGKVVGHTRAGKPIYSTNSYKDLHDKRAIGASSNEHALLAENRDKVLAKNPKWTAADHNDASAHHSENTSDHGSETGHHDGPTHYVAQLAHYHAARHLEGKANAKKSLAGLHESDPLHQMGSQFASKHPNFSAQDHMAAAEKHSKAGAPHLAIGHMLAASKLHTSAQKSMPVDILQEFVKSFAKPRAPGTIGTTQSGKPIHAPSSDGMFHRAKVKDYTHQDHMDAAAAHQTMADKGRAKWGKMVTGNSKPQNKNPMRSKLRDVSDHHMRIALTHRQLAPQTSKSMDAEAQNGDWFRDSVAMFTLSKAGKTGEGSRGGKVVGHTKSGAPIYQSGGAKHKGLKAYDSKKSIYDIGQDVEHNGKKVIASHPDYTKRDHGEAADHHFGMAEKDPKNSFHHYTHAYAHKWASLGDDAESASAERKAKAAKRNEPKFGHGVEKPTTRTGKRIPSIGRYKDLDQTDHHIIGSSDDANRHKKNGEKVMARHPKWTVADHQNAATHHDEIIEHGGMLGDGRTHKYARDAHRYAIHHLEQAAKTQKSMTAYLLKNEHLLAEALGHAV